MIKLINNLKVVIVMALFLLFYTGCKKDHVETSSSTENVLNRSSKTASSAGYQVGGTIGCGISYLGNGDFGAYSSCLDAALDNKNTIPGAEDPKSTKPRFNEGWDSLVENHPNFAEEVNDQLMISYWKFFGINSPDGEISLEDFWNIWPAIKKYNKVISAIFTDGTGTIVVPSGKQAQLNALRTFEQQGNVLPEGIIDYLNLAYSDYFYFNGDFRFPHDFEPPAPDPFYGMKLFHQGLIQTP